MFTCILVLDDKAAPVSRAVGCYMRLVPTREATAPGRISLMPKTVGAGQSAKLKIHLGARPQER
jgi:hypothetical protein